MLDVSVLGMAEIYDAESEALCFENMTFTEDHLNEYDWMRPIFKYAKYYSRYATNDGILLGCFSAINFFKAGKYIF